MADSSRTDHEILATLLRIENLFNERLTIIEALLRSQLEHTHNTAVERRRMLSALSMIAGNDAAHDD